MVALLIFISFFLAIIYIFNKEISTREFFVTLGCCVLTTLVIYTFSILPVPNDILYESSRLKKTTYHPFFIEKYEEPHTICTGTGKSTTCHTYYTTEYAKHQPYWTTCDNINGCWEISKNFHNIVKQDFGNHEITTQPNKCTHGGHIVSGDPNLYTYKNETNTFNYPTNRIVGWHNPLLGKNSIFTTKSSFTLAYPKRESIYITQRRVTTETNITQKEWDILNTKLYEASKVNLILIKVKNHEETKQLEQSWISGKKNDLVICFVGEYKKPEYIKVFGWSKSALVKLKLESYLLANGIQKSSLSQIEHIIKSYYKPYEFNKFDYLTTTPPLWVFILSLIVNTIILSVCIYSFSNNYENKDHWDDYFFN